MGRVRIVYHFQTVLPLKYRKGTRCVPYPAGVGGDVVDHDTVLLSLQYHANK